MARLEMRRPPLHRLTSRPTNFLSLLPTPQVRLLPAWKCLVASASAHIHARSHLAGATLTCLDMRLAVLQGLTSKHANTPYARPHLAGAFPRRPQVRLWPAWKCVSQCCTHSHPGTPTPSLTPPAGAPTWKNILTPALAHIRAHQPSRVAPRHSLDSVVVCGSDRCALWPAWKCVDHPCIGSHPGTPTLLRRVRLRQRHPATGAPFGLPGNASPPLHGVGSRRANYPFTPLTYTCTHAYVHTSLGLPSLSPSPDVGGRSVSTVAQRGRSSGASFGPPGRPSTATYPGTSIPTWPFFRYVWKRVHAPATAHIQAHQPSR